MALGSGRGIVVINGPLNGLLFCVDERKSCGLSA